MMNNIQSVKELIKNSVDYKTYNYSLVMGTVVTGIGVLFIGIPSLLLWEYQPYAAITMLVLSLLMGSPLWIYGLVKTKALCRSPERYVLCKAVLKEPHPAWRAISFEVHMDGGAVIESSPVFTSSQFSERGFDQWNNKNVVVAYDEATATVVILKTV